MTSDVPVTGVRIKAGRQLYSFTSGGASGCVTVTGLGTTHVRVRERREHRERNEISSVTVDHDCTPAGGGGGGSNPGGNMPG